MSTTETGRPMEELAFTERALEFLRERIDDPCEIDGDTELIDSGILDSLLVLEFFFFIEEVRGTPIDPEAASVDALSTIRRAYQLIA